MGTDNITTLEQVREMSGLFREHGRHGFDVLPPEKDDPLGEIIFISGAFTD